MLESRSPSLTGMLKRGAPPATSSLEVNAAVLANVVDDDGACASTVPVVTSPVPKVLSFVGNERRYPESAAREIRRASRGARCACTAGRTPAQAMTRRPVPGEPLGEAVAFAERFGYEHLERVAVCRRLSR